MSSRRSQRIGIWIIAIVMTVGTIGSFAAIVLGNNNDATTAQQQAAAVKQQQAAAKQAAQANADNSVALDGYSAQTFDPNVTTLGVETLVTGTGDAVKATDSIKASYFGWTSDGVIFDSSTKKDTGKDNPIVFPLSGVIQGWGQGLTGIPVGSTVRLTIPANLAYGSTGSGIIPANAPLQFIVEIHSVDNSASS